MTLIACLNKIMLKYKKEEKVIACFTETPIRRHSSRVEVKKGTSSKCGSCRKDEKKKIVFCRCCGKKLVEKSIKKASINRRPRINGYLIKNSTFKEFKYDDKSFKKSNVIANFKKNSNSSNKLSFSFYMYFNFD